MRIIRLFFVFIGLVLADKAHAFTVESKINKKGIELGGLIYISIKVTGINIQNVSWQAASEVFTDNAKIKLIAVKATANNSGSFGCDFIFTAIKPGNVIINPLPVIIKHDGRTDTVFTKIYAVKFKYDIALSTINDVKPIEKFNMAYIAEALVGLMFIYCLITVIVRIEGAIKLKMKKNISIERIRSIYLKRLQALEVRLIENIPPDTIEGLFDIFKGYLNEITVGGFTDVTELSVLELADELKLDHEDKQHLAGLLNAAYKLRFSYQQVMPVALKGYVDEVKAFIINYPILIS